MTSGVLPSLGRWWALGRLIIQAAGEWGIAASRSEVLPGNGSCGICVDLLVGDPMSLLNTRHTARGLRCLRSIFVLPALVLLASLQCVSPFSDSGTASQTNVVALSQSVVTLSDTMIASGAEATATLRLK